MEPPLGHRGSYARVVRLRRRGYSPFLDDLVSKEQCERNSAKDDIFLHY
jgi:hypothetical protein